MDGPIRVLYVDDSSCFQETTTYLEEHFVVESVSGETEGWNRVTDEQFDCVVSEYGIEGGDGIEFLEKVREEYPSLPFILFTGDGSEEVASSAITAGVTEYLQKGDDRQLETLATRIERCVAEYRETQEETQARQRFQEITDSIPDCLWMFDRDWEELLFISGYETVWKRPTEQIEENPQDFLHSVHPDDREYVRQSMERISGGEPIEIEYRILRGDGELGWVWVKGQPITDDDGTVRRVAGFTRDITGRKERENKLEVRTGAINEAPLGIVITDPSQADNPVTYANDAFLELTGYSLEEVLGRNCRFLQGPETDETRIDTMRNAIEAEESVTVELRNYRKDGTVFWNRVSIAPVYDEQGEVVSYVGFQEDVSERRRRQQQLQVIDRVLRHNVRNAMNVVQSHAELIKSNRDEQTADSADRIISQASKLVALTEKERLVTDVLADRPQSHQLDLAVILDRQVTVTRSEYPAAEITVDCPASVTVTAGKRFEQAIRELLDNALTHNDTSTPTVSIAVAEADDAVTIEVTDNGPPIPEIERTALRGQILENPLYHGSGLGLWLINLIVMRADGTLEYEKNEPRGNLVRIILPHD